MNNAAIIEKTARLSLAGIILLSLIVSGCAATEGGTPAATTGQPSLQPAQQAAAEKPNPAAIGTVVSLSIANRNIKAGDTFNVDVVVDAKVAIRGAQATVTFDPALMKVNEITEGDFLKGWAIANQDNTLIFPDPVMDNEKGTADIGVAIMGMTPGGPKDKGILWSYSFTALKDGTAAPKLANVLLVLQDEKDPTVMVDLPETDLTIIN